MLFIETLTKSHMDRPNIFSEANSFENSKAMIQFELVLLLNIPVWVVVGGT